MTNQMIDTHTHLDDPAFEDDLDQVISDSRRASVTGWINVGYEPARWRSTLALANRVGGMRYMLGMHPGNADEWNADTASQLESLVATHDPVAIGEIGIDLYWRQDNLDAQVNVLMKQLELARKADLPVVIHMRGADQEMLDVLNGMAVLPRLHFHSFDGNDSLRRYVVENACTIGVGGLMTRRPSESLRRWLTAVPRDQVVLETDAPYLKPQGIRGRRNEPAFLARTADRLAELWQTTAADVARITYENARRIFRL